MCGESHSHGKSFLITSDVIGPERELGRILMVNFLATLADNPGHAELVLLMNSGVKLAAEGADTAASLKKLTDKGVALFSCGTCLEYYDLKGKLAAGSVGSMTDTVGALVGHGEVVTIC